MSDFVIRKGRAEDLPRWMELVRSLRANFPGLETEEALAEHREIVERNMDRGTALCAAAGEEIVGILIYSPRNASLSCMAVDPRWRRRGIGRALVSAMLDAMPGAERITVSTFRAGDPLGDAPRALYASLGFLPGEETIAFGYPNQEMILERS